MKKILNKIFSKQSAGQLALAGGGFLIGLLLLLLSSQLYLRLSHLLSPESQYSDFLIISKKIDIANTLTGGRPSFSNEEIEELKKQRFVKKVGVFKTNQFRAWTYGNEMIPLTTDLFFETIPADMMGEVPNGWNWQPEDDYVPVVASMEFLNGYNFVYAPAQGLPPLPKESITLVPPLRTKLSSDKGEIFVKMKLVGLNERITSILVPEEFMDWANNKLGKVENMPPARIMVQINNPSDPQLLKFIEEKKWVVNQDKLLSSQAGAVAKNVMTVVGSVGVLFILLALVIFVMNFRVILAEAKDEIRLLQQLGYTVKMIGNHLIGNFTIFIFVLAVLAGGALWGGVQLMQSSVKEQLGLDLGEGIDIRVIWLGLGFIALSLLANIFAISRLLRKYA